MSANKKTPNRKPPRRGNNKRRDKEVEVNVDRNDVNAADMRGANSKSKSPVSGRNDGRNDVSWYATNEALLRDAASFPFSNPVGNRIHRGVGSVAYKSPSNAPESVPGIMTFLFSSCTGNNQDGATSPLNIASTAIYSFVRHANSGSKVYDAPDLMMYLMAMDSAYSFYAFMVRVYGSIQQNSAYNRYMPRALTQAQGVDYDDISQNLAQFRYFINQYAFKLSQLCVPADMSFFARHVWMCTNVYLDSDTEKGQMYMYVPTSYYHFVEQTNSPGYLQYKTFRSMADDSSGLLTYKSLINIANDILQPILESEDMGVMSGDILKAFGADNLYKISPIAENYFVQPVYNAEVLSQMENIVLAGDVYLEAIASGSPRYWDITQEVLLDVANTPYINQQIATYTGIYDADKGQLWGNNMTLAKCINFHHSNVTPADVMVATRLTNLPEKAQMDPNFNPFLTYQNTGSEIVHNAYVWEFGSTSTGKWICDNYKIGTYMVLTTEVDNFPTEALFQSLSALSKFDWHPEVNVLFNTAQGGGTAFSSYGRMDYFDIDNYAYMTQEDLNRLHETALLSLFSVPRMGALSKSPVR